MNPAVEKRRATIINVVYFVMIAAIFYLVFKTFFSMILPFIAAFCFAALLQRPVNFITKKTPLKRGVTGTLIVLLLLGVVGSLVVLLGMQLAGQLRGFYDFIVLKLQNLNELCEDIKNWLIGAISFLPQSMRESLSQSITSFFNNLIENGLSNLSFSSFKIDWSSLLSKGGGVIKDTVVQIPSVIVGIVISIVSCVFITIDYDRISHFVLRQFSDFNTKRVVAAKQLAVSTMKKMLKAYSLIVLITTAELSVGFTMLKLLGIYNSGYIMIISIIIAIIDIIPVLGTGTVLIPWAVYSFITADISMGIGLLIIYAVILVIRQIIEPKLVAGQAGLPPIVTIIAMYIGTKTLGILGFFILPFAVILLKEFNEAGIIHVFKTSAEKEKKAQSDTPDGAAAENDGSSDKTPLKPHD